MIKFSINAIFLLSLVARLASMGNVVVGCDFLANCNGYLRKILYLCLIIVNGLFRSMMRFAILLLSLAVLFSCGGRASNATVASSELARPAIITPKNYNYVIRNVYPHARTSYTQGLFWYDGTLWESTGEYGRSTMRRVELESGRAIKSVGLPKREFGEGAVLLDSVIYQITWREGVAHLYDVPSLKERKTINYSGEGWGIATDGEWLYMSDGTEKIYKLDPTTFKRVSTIVVTFKGQPLSLINEMEWIDGKLWANVYLTESIVVIDPTSGQVEGVLDLMGLLSESDMDVKTDVLNGIAYDGATGRIFITGKNWPKLFEIEVFK